MTARASYISSLLPFRADYLTRGPSVGFATKGKSHPVACDPRLGCKRPCVALFPIFDPAG